MRYLILIFAIISVQSYACCNSWWTCSSGIELYCCNSSDEIDNTECIPEIWTFYHSKYSECINNFNISHEWLDTCLQIRRKYEFWFKVIRSIKESSYTDEYRDLFDITLWNIISINKLNLPNYIKQINKQFLFHKDMQFIKNDLTCWNYWKMLYKESESDIKFYCDENAFLKYGQFISSDQLKQNFYAWEMAEIHGMNLNFDQMNFTLNLIDTSNKVLMDTNNMSIEWNLKWEINNDIFKFYIPIKYEWTDWKPYYIDSNIKKIRLNIYEKPKWFWLAQAVYPYYVDLNLISDSKDSYTVNQFYIWNQQIDKVWDIKWKTVVIAIIDDWVYFDNNDLEHAKWQNKKEIFNKIDDDKNTYIDDTNWWNFIDWNGIIIPSWSHWTCVAWLIAAAHNNNYWLKWINENTIIMPLIIANPEIKLENIVNAIDYAVKAWAKIINLSLNGPFTKAYSDSIKKAVNAWVIIVAAAWNNWTNLDQTPSSPACNDVDDPSDVITVWALDIDWIPSKFSNYWWCVDFWSYWTSIFSSAKDGYSQFSDNNWTSFSAPIVSWIISLWLKIRPELNSKEIYKALKASVENNIINADKFIQNIKNYKPEIKLFNDVKTNSSLYDATKFLLDKQIISGYPDWSFKPYRAVNRAEIIKLLITSKYWLNYNKSWATTNFTDTSQNEWYSPFLNKAVSMKIVWWYPDWSFRPNAPVNTAEFLKFLNLTFKLQTGLQYTYKDIPNNAWYKPYIWIASKYQLFPSRKDKLNPESRLTRQDIAIALYNYFKATLSNK